MEVLNRSDRSSKIYILRRNLNHCAEKQHVLLKQFCLSPTDQLRLELNKLENQINLLKDQLQSLYYSEL